MGGTEWAGRPGLIQTGRSDVWVRTYGCLAMIIGLFELDLTVRGGDLSEEARFHSVWAKRGQGVQFVSWQSTRVPPRQ